MGVATYSNTMRVCATCANFSGDRTPKSGFTVDVDNYKTGQCYRDFAQGVDKSPGMSCAGWTKWSALK